MSIQKWYKITVLPLYTDILLFNFYSEIFQTHRKAGRTVHHILIHTLANLPIITFCLISSIYIGVVSVFTFCVLADLLENHRHHEYFISKKFEYVSTHK